MQYLGGKHRIAKPLGAYLQQRLEGRYFVEPFCGALNVSAQMTGKRIASDGSPYLFTLYRALREGWEPPEAVTEEEYARVKADRDPENPLTAFVGYGCSFGGKFFGGYARMSPGRGSSYCQAARNALQRKMEKCAEATFAHCDYREGGSQ